jgi:hypothetical protein
MLRDVARRDIVEDVQREAVPANNFTRQCRVYREQRHSTAVSDDFNDDSR